jgi:Neuraminidase (sialidase)
MSRGDDIRKDMKIDNTGILNASSPKTHRAFSTFPAVTSLPNGKLLAAYRVGSSKDCDDEAIEVRESEDLGLTWSSPRSPFPSFTENGHAHSLKLVYFTLLPTGTLLAAAMAVDRGAHPGCPLFNDATQGCLPMRILLSRSEDSGRSWEEWQPVDTPADIGPPSLTNPLLLLADGRLAMSLESNKTYLDKSPWLQKVTYLFSNDEGRNWEQPVVVAQDPTGRIFNWDQRAGVTPDNAIVTFTWVFDSQAGVYLNIWKRYSLDGGVSWSNPEDVGFADQASRPAIFADGRLVLAWVDRFGMQAIRVRSAFSFREPFDASSEVVLYQSPTNEPGKTGLGDTLDEMSRWAYGLPFMHPLSNGEVLVVYYAGNSTGTSVHWARVAID